MKKIFSDSIIYLGTNFLSKAVSFILIPLLTNIAYVSVEGYGQIILFSSFSLLLNPFIAFGGIDIIAINYFDKNADHDALIRQSNSNAFFLFLFTTVVLLLFSPLLNRSFDVPVFIVIVVPLSALLNYYTEELLLLLRFKGNAKGYLKIFLIKIFLDVGVTLFCLIILRWGWYSRIAGFFAGYIFTLIVTIKLVRLKNIIAPFSCVQFRKFIITSFPFVFLQFFIIGLTNIDKLIIPRVFGNEKEYLALYGLAFQLGYLLPTVTSALTTMTQPIVYQLLSNYDIEANTKLRKVIIISFAVIFISAVFIYLCTPYFYYYFISNNRYEDGAYLVKYMLIAWMFWCFGAILIDIIKKIGSRRQIVNSYFIPFLVLVSCLYFAGHQYGLRGITWALILSYSLIFSLLVYYTRKQLSVHLRREFKSISI
jgi:O-antigen/teichoic acid export membrane protein